MEHKVDIAETPAIAVAAVRFHVGSEDMPRIGEQIGRAFGTVVERLQGAELAPTGPAVACYEPAADGFDVAAGFQVPLQAQVPSGLERLDLGGVEAAHTTHVGAYSDLHSAYDDLQAQAKAAGRELGNQARMWEEYWSGPETPESETRTEIYWPVAGSSRTTTDL